MKLVEGVREVKVVSCPDDIRFEAPIILVEGIVDSGMVKRFIRETVGPIAEPRDVVILDRIPELPLSELKESICLKKGLG